MVRTLYISAIGLYVLSLTYPFDGIWFFGLVMASMTAIFSAGIITSMELSELASFSGALFLLFVASPFYNLVFLWCAFSFGKIKSNFEIKNITLMVAAFFSIFVSAKLTIDKPSDFLAYFL
ncbi:hypothetical protein HXX02_00170 [Microbulbifer elongatus]|uniref:Uncharacterized protein n=1 Tax=Microbulbifer elongatus TaxID=86173 RepID=A0ABT1NVC4_9GAMM|nr:hypothetical protein [Microbulbifer elongatus]MCQ3827850.1 hypothetical protein [Microbulbifer elongatus]